MTPTRWSLSDSDSRFYAYVRHYDMQVFKAALVDAIGTGEDSQGPLSGPSEGGPLRGLGGEE